MADAVLISMNKNIMLSLYYVCSLCPPNYLFKSDDAKYISFFITQSAPVLWSSSIKSYIICGTDVLMTCLTNLYLANRASALIMDVF